MEEKKEIFNRKLAGVHGEQTAADFLERQGLRILERNFRCRTGEIDLIAWDGSYLVFVEVKYRRSLQMGDPAEAVDWRKQKKIRGAAQVYLYAKGKDTRERPCRFDVVAVLGEEIRWIQNAF